MNRQEFKYLMYRMMKKNPSLSKHQAYYKTKMLVKIFGDDILKSLKGGCIKDEKS